MTNHHANKGSYVCSVWTDDRKKWLIENTKGMKRQEAYDLFCKAFPEVKTTLVAVTNQRSRLRCAEYTCKHGSTKMKPLYAEREKKGYMFVKVALPSTWWSKAKFVYVATHPEEAGELKETDAFYFMDGNKRNFDWKNIERVPRKLQAVYIGCGGIVKDDPEQSRINLLQAKLKQAQLDAGEKSGLVVTYGDSRMFREELNAKAREQHHRYYNDPEKRKRIRERAKYYREHWTEEQEAHRREYQREWARKKRSRYL